MDRYGRALFYVYTEAGESVTDNYRSIPLNHSNDVVGKSDASIYFTDLGLPTRDLSWISPVCTEFPPT